jgi:glycerophosphoryl diester phosphodiesterase
VNPFLERSPVVFAHQGGALEAPSSTRFAIAQAIAAGVDGIELDVHQSRDGVLVVCHDPTVDRTSNGHGAIATLTITELVELDAAYAFVPGQGAVSGLDPSAYPLRGRAPRDSNLGFARLSDVLEDTRGLLLNLDIKQSAPAVPPYESTLAALLRRHERTDAIVASFNDDSLEAFHAAAPEVATVPGMRETTAFVQAIVAGAPVDERLSRHVALQVPPKIAGVRLVDERFVLGAHRAGLAVHVWTVDEPEEMESLLSSGVDGIMSDRPTLAVAVVARHRNGGQRPPRAAAN